MKKELQDKLFNDFPLLYGDRTKSMTQTAMCWGIETGDGWFDILYEMSQKIEPEIEKTKEENKEASCNSCWCKKHDHNWIVENTRPLKIQYTHCGKVHHFPYSIDTGWSVFVHPTKRSIKLGLQNWRNFKFYIWRDLIKKWLFKKNFVKYIVRPVNKFLNFLHKKYNIGYYKKCRCKQYEIAHPRASQVKEKYGTLRVYMTYYDEKIEEYITEAERKSAVTCETCGAEGKQRDGGWILTLCDKCNTERYNKD